MIPIVSNVMTRDIYAVAPDTSIETVARLITTRHIGGVPVIRPDGTPVGVVSLFDLVDPDKPRTRHTGHPTFYRIDAGRAERLGDDIQLTDGRVSDVMSPFVLSVDGGASVLDAANLMLKENVHRLLVLEGGKLVGMVTTTDLLRGFASTHVSAGSAA
jgi:CBS domain-containing protein